MAKATASERTYLHAYRLGFNPGWLRLEVAYVAESWGMHLVPPAVGPTADGDSTVEDAESNSRELVPAVGPTADGDSTATVETGSGSVVSALSRRPGVVEYSDLFPVPEPDNFPDRLDYLPSELMVSAQALAGLTPDRRAKELNAAVENAARAAWEGLHTAWPAWADWAWNYGRTAGDDPLGRLVCAAREYGAVLGPNLNPWYRLGGLVQAALSRIGFIPTDAGPPPCVGTASSAGGPAPAAALGDLLQQMVTGFPWLTGSIDFSHERWRAVRTGAGDNTYVSWVQDQANRVHSLVVRRLSESDSGEAVWVSPTVATIAAEHFNISLSLPSITKWSDAGAFRTRSLPNNRREVEIGDFLRYVWVLAEKKRTERPDGVGEAEAEANITIAQMAKWEEDQD